MQRRESTEDRIFRQIHALQLQLQNCQDSLVLITDELTNLNLSQPRQMSNLTRQFNMMSSPDVKRRAMKETPDNIREIKQKKRVELTHLGQNLYRSNTMLNGQTIHSPSKSFEAMERDILIRKKNRENNAMSLDSLAQRKISDYNEVSDASEASDSDNSLSESDFVEGFTFKSKGNKSESIKKYIKRIYNSAIRHGLRVINTVKGLQFILDKLQKVQSGFVYTQKDLVDAEKDMAKMQNLFQRMIEFIDSKESIKSLRM
jgi:hypothetical protein